MRSKVSRNFVLLAPPGCGEVSANKSANVGALIFIVTLFGSVLIIAYHPSFVQRFPDKLEVEYLELNRLQNSLKNGQLDLVLSSAGNYRRFLLEGYGLRDLATMVSNQAPNPNYAEGSVFFVRSDRKDLDSIASLKDKSVSANYPFAFSGWQIAAGELMKRGFDPDHFFSKMDFLGHGAAPVIDAVMSGKTDAGIVRRTPAL